MEFFSFFLVLGSIFGCFPAKLRFILGKEPFAPLKYRHYGLSVFFLLLLNVQLVEFCLGMRHHEYIKLGTSHKISMMMALITYVISDTYFRLYGIIYGRRLSLLIDDLRKIKKKFTELSESLGIKVNVSRRERRWFTVGTAVGLALQYIHVPLRVYDFYSNRHTYGHEFFLFPENPGLLIPLVFFIEIGGMICRSFALAIIVCIGLELLESYRLLNALAEKLNSSRNSNEELEINRSSKTRSLLIDSFLKEEGGRKSVAESERVLQEQFFEIQSVFHRFNHILGSYAFIILLWAMGNMLMEIRSLPTQENSEVANLPFDSRRSISNDLASIFGTLFGLVVTYLICLLGHKIEYAVRKHKERMKFLRVKNPQKYNGKVHECLSLFKWEFTAKGLFVINLSLIPRIAGAIFSITIFHLQLEISERQFPTGGQNLNSVSPTSSPSESIFTTIRST